MTAQLQPEDAVTPLAPLRRVSFRRLWTAWVAACLSLWMTEVAAAWLMTSLTSSPVMVALVQSAATLPVFLLGLPSGALADIVDRRRLLIFTQVWAFLVAASLCVATLAGWMTPVLLLLLVFANGTVLAARWPAYSAITPELVPAHEVADAFALNGVANHGSRIVGPLIAGVIIATAGSGQVFALNAGLSILAAVLVARWQHVRKPSTLPSEPIASAIRIGMQHVRQSAGLQRVLVRVASFSLHSIALIALLPLVARQLGGGSAGTFSLLVAGLGTGAVSGAFLMPMANRRLTDDSRFAIGTLLFALASVLAAFAPNLLLGMAATFIAGIAYMLAFNTVMVAATRVLPDWVRARGLSVYQMVLMGSSAAGAALWGAVASFSSVSASLVVSAVVGVFGLLVINRMPLVTGRPEDLAPAGSWSTPELAAPVDPERGPVLVMVEYRIDPARTDEFLALMGESRRAWLGNGLREWNLFSDVAQAGRHIEHMVDASWAAYVRRNERVSASYVALREQKRAMHVGEGAPVVTRYIAERVAPWRKCASAID